MDADKKVTLSINQHDAQTADYLAVLARKMTRDLTKQIESRIDFMFKKAHRNITRRYRNSLNNYIAHMNYKKLKSSGKKLKIRRNSDGEWICAAKPVSPPPSLRIDTGPDTRQHSDSTPLPESSRPHSHSTDNDTDLSKIKGQTRSSIAIDVASSNPKVTAAKKTV